MVEHAHRQSHGASEQSLDLLFKRLEELQMRQEACDARLEADEKWQRDHEQATKDAIRVLMLMRSQDVPVNPEIPEALASGGVNRPGRPKLRVIMGGLAVAAGAALIPAGAAAVTHHHHQAHHVTAAHSRRARDADPAGERIDG